VYHRYVRRTRWPLRITAAIALLGVVLLALPASRHAGFRAMGRTLVADDPVRPADAIVVTVDAGAAGVLEAADLVREGLSRRVALFADLPDAVDRELARRGIEYEDEATREAALLRMLGVDHVDRIPMPITGTEDEGRVFPAWCDARQLRTVIVVSSADHSRRLRRVFHRAMQGHATAVLLRPSRYSDFDPESWWRKRAGVRREIVELQKLMFDVLRHPIS
jgi:uncharacterized SAM-binding protein YcdF (DUF218 family)